MKITTEKIYKIKMGDQEYTFNETEVKNLYNNLGELLGIQKSGRVIPREWSEKMNEVDKSHYGKWIPNDPNPLNPTPLKPTYNPIEIWCGVKQ